MSFKKGMKLISNILLLLLPNITASYCLECNGKCKCYDTIMDCSSTGVKSPFIQIKA